MDGCVWIVVIFMVIAVIAAINQAKAREKAREQYQDALSRLTREPANPSRRQEALEFGRAYARLMRSRRGVALFDEVALSNDISAACAGAAQPRQRESRREPSIPTRLANLSELRASGLIDDDEYATRRREILRDI